MQRGPAMKSPRPTPIRGLRALITRTLVLLACLTLASTSAYAQYFGQNKVQYEKFDFKVLKTEHFDIYFYPEEEAAVRLAARMAERWYARLSSLLNHELSSRQPLILYAAHPHFRQTNAISGDVGEGTGGVTESLKRRVVLPFAGGMAETDHVLGHELVHAFQYDMAAGQDSEGNIAGPGLNALPLWFIEGMAEYLSIGPVDANTAMWVRDASSREQMPTLGRLDDPDFFPYRYGHAFWAYVAGRWGDEAVGEMLRATGPQGDIRGAIETVLGISEETFNTDWHAETRKTFAPFFETTRKPDSFGRAAFTEGTTSGDMNLSPSISPDGKRVVFLSERSRFSIDMYLGDVSSGRVIKRLVETASDPHFDSLEFLNSSGDWAPDNRRFVFSALSSGRPVLAIIDVDTGRREDDHPFEKLDQIFNPAWSPDGQRIAFSALAGGVLDLYVYELSSRTLTPLTSDPFADLDPEWAPNGRELAWVTDRFSSNLDRLEWGNYRIGSIEITSKTIRELAGFPRGRATNPEYSADGRSLYFVATPDGVPDVYRATVPAGDVTRVTNVLSGVSGITPLTPALSVAASAPQLLFTVFEEDKYNIYAIETPEKLTGQLTTAPDRDGAVLPPYTRKPGRVAELLAAPTEGLPPATAPVEEEEYKAGLGLDVVGQPVVGVGADRFGTYAAGGLSFLFSDMLGDHQLGATVQVSGRIEEIGGALMYINRSSRWNWGVVGESTPYVYGGYSQGFTLDPNGNFVFAEQEQRITQTNRGVSFVTQYPFSRAHRVELSGGARRISFDSELRTRTFSPDTGQFIDDFKEELPRPDALNLAESSAALVYDSSVFGVTSPILGQRYRLEYTQSMGSLNYGGVLLDYRRYFMPVRPLTFAFRGLHFGRYGGDSDDTRLSQMYVGDYGLVRGYNYGSFEATECGNIPNACPALEQLFGTRLGIINAELRAPLIGLFRPSRMYGGVPVEVAVFADAGIAWTSQIKVSDRDVVRSVGAGLRFNAFGYVIGEIDYVKPIDRPERGWLWQFTFTPGF
jgi:Tol biopolymer transport system component